jgi:hypothetical protein
MAQAKNLNRDTSGGALPTQGQSSDIAGDITKVALSEGTKKGLKLALGKTGTETAAKTGADALVKTGTETAATGLGSAAATAGLSALGNIGGGLLDEGGTTRSTARGIGGGAMKGAAMGATAGSVVPVLGNAVGATVGAAIGGISGVFSAAANRKKEATRIEREKIEKLGDIEEKKAQKLTAAFSNLGASLSGLF